MIYAVTNTRTKFTKNINNNEYIKTEFLGCFDTLEEAQKAIAKFTEKIQSKVEEVRLCSSGDCEFYVTEVRGILEYRNNLEIHVRLK
ncbi:hypothetical protein HCH14_12740 [Enterococcus faecalis]|nr:hypothetical protein [Enterococcus faecalis]